MKTKIIATAVCVAAFAASAAGTCKLCGRKGTCFEKHGRWYCATLKKGGGPGGPVQAHPPGFGKKGHMPPPAYGGRPGHDGVPKKPEHWKKPEYGTKPGYGARPEYGARPGYGGKPEYGHRQPQWKQPEYGKKPEQGAKPGYGAKTEYGAKPSYGSKPTYGTGSQQGQAGQQVQIVGTSVTPSAIKVDTTPIMMGGPTTHVKKADVDYLFNPVQKSADGPNKDVRQYRYRGDDRLLPEKVPAPDRKEKL